MSNTILKIILFSAVFTYLASGCALLNRDKPVPLSDDNTSEPNTVEPIDTPLLSPQAKETQKITVEEENMVSNNLSGKVTIASSSGELLIDNQTESQLYFTIFETSRLSIIEWGPCEHPDNCENEPIGTGQSKLFNSSQVDEFLNGKTELTVAHWNLNQSGSTFAVDNLEYVSIIP